jgi:hypothetical protein
METKDYFIIGMAILGWTWGIVQFILNRKYQKSDKIIEKKFDIYSNFMNKIDEMNLNMRNDPKLILGIPTEFLTEVLSEDKNRIDNALLKFNSDLMEMTKNSLKPTMIVNQELNKLSLIASNKMLPKISEYKELVSEFTTEFQTILNSISTIDDWGKNALSINEMGKNEKAIRMGILWNEIQELMRKELSY